MKLYVDNIPDNCNHCIYRQDISRHWDLDDYCSLNKKSTSRIIMDEDCSLKEQEGKNT